MPVLREVSSSFAPLESPSYFLDILAQDKSETWVLHLPPRLKTFERELELLLCKVFTGRPRSRENLELAQQLTLNWCLSKCRKMGIALEESFHEV